MEPQDLDQIQPAPASEPEAPAVEQQAAPQPPPEPAINEGIQKRIDELTARYHRAERDRDRVQAERDAQASQMQELMLAFTRQQQPQTPDPLSEIHPDDKRRVEAIVSPFVKRQEEVLRRLEESHRMQQVERIASQIGDQRVADLAMKLQGEWTKRNLSGWTEQDAVIHAAGLVALQDRERAQGTDRDAKGRFSPAPKAQPVEPLHAQAAPAAGAGQARSKGLPADIDDLIQSDPNRAAEILEKHLDSKRGR